MTTYKATNWYDASGVQAYYDVACTVPALKIERGEVVEIVQLHGKDPASQVIEILRTSTEGITATFYVPRKNYTWARKTGIPFDACVRLNLPVSDPVNTVWLLLCRPRMLFSSREPLKELRLGRIGETFFSDTKIGNFYRFRYGDANLEKGFVEEWANLPEGFGPPQDMLLPLYEVKFEKIPIFDPGTPPPPDPELTAWQKFVAWLKKAWQAIKDFFGWK